jgi:hypothetical protein
MATLAFGKQLLAFVDALVKGVKNHVHSIS